jgi:DNA-binding CsgD family transcriptional regulator
MNDNQSRSTPFPLRTTLTSTEQQLLEMLAQGWTAREAAGQVDLGVKAALRHIDILRRKMRARNTPHLIARAFSKGILKIVKGVVRVTDSTFEP